MSKTTFAFFRNKHNFIKGTVLFVFPFLVYMLPLVYVRLCEVTLDVSYCTV